MKQSNDMQRRICVLLLAMLWLLPAISRAAMPADTKVSVDFKSVPVVTVLNAIQKQAGLSFVYSTEEAAQWPRVTIRATKKSAAEVVEQLTSLIGCSYTIKGNIVTITKQQYSGRERTVKGYVKDEAGEPLVGVPISIGEGKVATVTDIDGFFTFKIPVEATVLKFSYVGLANEYVQVPQGTADVSRNITMRADNQLGEVVVTGIFNKAKESYTGAVTTIGKEDLKMHKGQNLLQTLKTIDASMNFQVNNLAGSNPNNLPQINIRGNSSLPMSVAEFNSSTSNAVNTPLIILDGFEMSLEKLMDYNDEEIESINILKDAAATAIYGSRGSNGVIVVTTRQPEVGKLRINAEVGVDIEAPDLTSYDYLTAREKLELENSLNLYSADYANNDYNFQEHYNTKLKSVLSGATTDWLNKPVRTGVGPPYNLRLEGGSDQFRWAISTNYKDTEGAMKNSYRRSFNGSIQLVYTLKNVTFKNYTTLGLVRSQESNFGNFNQYVALQPYDIPYDENGALRQYFEAFLGPSQGTGRANPLYDAELNTINKSGHETLTNNFAIEWKIIPDLTFRGQFGISKLNNNSDYFLPAEHSYFTTNSYGHYYEYNSDEGFLRRGLYRYGTGNGYSYDGNATLSYSHLFADKHLLYVGADYSISARDNLSYTFTAEGVSDSENPFLGNARQYLHDGKPGGSKSKSRRIGLTTNVNYTYDGRYYLDFSYRVDGSSTFGSEKKWAPFWSTGIGWNVHNEKFLKDNPVLNILRLKASIGEVGSQMGSGTGANTIFHSITSSKYMNWIGSQLTAWGNPRLTWQTTRELNLGVEFGVLKGLLKGEFNFYDKVTSNLLSNMDLPSSMGINNYIANVGEVKNRGWELALSGYPIRDMRHGFTWMMTGQLVYNKNWISKLSDYVKAQTESYREQNVDVSTLFYEGRPQNSIYAVKSLGINPSTGEEIYVDRDGNVTDSWRPGDKVFCGQSDPKYRGNFGNILRYKGWTLNFTFTYYWGGYRYNSTLLDKVEVPIAALKSQNVDRRALTDRWMKPGDVTFFKGYSENATRATSRFVMKDNVLELSTASLQYRWDGPWLRKNLGMQSMIFGLNTSDLVHWGTIRQERGINYPYARNIQASVKLLF